MENKKCIGCGAPLQTEYIDKAGFVPKITSETNYCKRCFRLNNYNEMPKILANPEDYKRVLDACLKKNGLIVLIVDIFDFQGTFVKDIIDILRGRDVILVSNKYDILPKSTKSERIVEWVSTMTNKVFFSVLAIHIVSSKKGYYIDDLMNTIDIARRGRDVYFVGCANVGKSSLINALLKRFTSRETDVISTSEIPGTTLDVINIPFFDDNKALIDTPGLINENNILTKLLPESYKKILPVKEIKPITYQIKPENSVFISGLAIFDLISGEDVSFTCYFSDRLLVHRTKTRKKEELLINHLGELLNPPTILEKDSIIYDECIFNIKENTKMDIVISGLGFVSINKKASVRVSYIKGTDVYLRNAIIGK